MEIIFTIASFAFATTFTPGPNNVLLLSSGLRFGFVKTLAHIAGIQCGVATQLVLSALGFGILLMSLPFAEIALKVLGTCYLTYLAWNMRRFSLNENSANEKPKEALLKSRFISLRPAIRGLKAREIFKPRLKQSFPNSQTKPFRFSQAWLFQFVNPKAWMLTITAGSLFLPDFSSKSLSIATLCIVFIFVGTFSSCCWTVLGASIRHFLQTRFWQNCFSGLMITITLYTAVAIWFF